MLSVFVLLVVTLPPQPELTPAAIIQSGGVLPEAEESSASENPNVLEDDGFGSVGGPESGEGAESGALYSGDVSDQDLPKLWAEAPEKLGSVTVGTPEAGRLFNGVQIQDGRAWEVVDKINAWATQETADFLMAAASAVREKHPNCGPLRIGHISKRDGGFLSPHKSHQSGRDVDLSFYYPNDQDPGHANRRELAMDLELNWTLVKTLIVNSDVEFILVDKRIQTRLYAWALAHGEDREWLNRLFLAGPHSIVKHAKKHRDHFHVRFYGARSQELGRRIVPLLNKSRQNQIVHRVKPGETLGDLAARFNSTVKLIQKANGLTSVLLRVGKTLTIPIRGPCTKCPMPRPIVLPPRLLPPQPPPDA